MKHLFFMILLCVFIANADTLKLHNSKAIPVKLLSFEASLADNSISHLTFKTRLKLEMKIPKDKIDYVVYKGMRYAFVCGRYFADTSAIPLPIFELSPSEFKKGVYRNYAEFYFNDPTFPQDSLVITKASPNGIDSDEFLLAKIKKRKKLIERKYKYKSDYWGYCDGERIYIKGPRYLSRLHFDSIGIWFWDLSPFPFSEISKEKFTHTLDSSVKYDNLPNTNAKWSWSDDSTYWKKVPCLVSYTEGINHVKHVTPEVLSTILKELNKAHYFIGLPNNQKNIALNRAFEELVAQQKNVDGGYHE